MHGETMEKEINWLVLVTEKLWTFYEMGILVFTVLQSAIKLEIVNKRMEILCF